MTVRMSDIISQGASERKGEPIEVVRAYEDDTEKYWYYERILGKSENTP
jgi:hypothetical protein